MPSSTANSLFQNGKRGIFTPMTPASKVELPTDLPEVQEGRMQHLQPKAMY